MKLFNLLDQRLHAAIKFALPFLECPQLLLCFAQRLFGPMNCELLDRSFFAKCPQPSAEQCLLSLFQLLVSTPDLVVPMKALFVLEPQAGTDHFSARFVKCRPRLAQVNDEVRAESFEGVEGGDMGFLRHARYRWFRYSSIRCALRR